MEGDRIGVGRVGDGGQPCAASAAGIIFEKSVETLTEAVLAVRGANANQRYIGDLPWFGDHAKKIGQHAAVAFLDDEGAVDQLVDVHGVVHAERALRAPEVDNVRHDLPEVGVGG